MELIEKEIQLRKNLTKIDSYLSLSKGTRYEKATDLVKRGRDFVVYVTNGQLRFAPSRFIGYINNNIKKHKVGPKDGRKTSPKIKQVLKKKWVPEEDLIKHHAAYCRTIGVKSCKYKKKFILLDKEAERLFKKRR